MCGDKPYQAGQIGLKRHALRAMPEFYHLERFDKKSCVSEGAKWRMDPVSSVARTR